MAKARREGTKKHGDELESLIDRTGNDSTRSKTERTGDNPTELQDDDDEDVQNDDVDDRRDVYERTLLRRSVTALPPSGCSTLR